MSFVSSSVLTIITVELGSSLSNQPILPPHSIRSGGVVSNVFFQQSFGIRDGDVVNDKKRIEISSNVVSVLQAGAFFGALGSAPLSGTSF